MGKRERKACVSKQSAFYNEVHELKGVFPRKIMNLDSQASSQQRAQLKHSMIVTIRGNYPAEIAQ